MRLSLLSLVVFVFLLASAPAAVAFGESWHFDTNPLTDPHHPIRDRLLTDNSQHDGSHDNNNNDHNNADDLNFWGHQADENHDGKVSEKEQRDEINRQANNDREHYLHLYKIHQHKQCLTDKALYESRHPLIKPASLASLEGCALYAADASYHSAFPTQPTLLGVVLGLTDTN